MSETAVDAMLVAVTLHSLLRCKSCESYTPPDLVGELKRGQIIYDGPWRQDNAQNVMLPLPTHTHTQNSRYPKKC